MKKAWCWKCNKATDFSLWEEDVQMNMAITGGPKRYKCPSCKNTVTPKVENEQPILTN